jgi:hypothetical protein
MAYHQFVRKYEESLQIQNRQNVYFWSIVTSDPLLLPNSGYLIWQAINELPE